MQHYPYWLPVVSRSILCCRGPPSVDDAVTSDWWWPSPGEVTNHHSRGWLIVRLSIVSKCFLQVCLSMFFFSSTPGPMPVHLQLLNRLLVLMCLTPPLKHLITSSLRRKGIYMSWAPGFRSLHLHHRKWLKTLNLVQLMSTLSKQKRMGRIGKKQVFLYIFLTLVLVISCYFF